MKTKNVNKNKNNKRKVARAASPSVRGRGRPALEGINLVRKGEFSIHSLYNALRGKVSRMTLSNHLKRAVLEKRVKIIGRKRTSARGASSRVFQTVLRQPRAAKSVVAAPVSVAVLA